MTEYTYSLADIDPLAVLGVNNQRLRKIQDAFPEVSFHARGSELRISGSETDIELLRKLIDKIFFELASLKTISNERFDELIELFPAQHHAIQDEHATLLTGTQGLPIRPKTSGQMALVAAARENDIVFAIGPAGTGKTYTAVAIGVKALREKSVKKIVLVRPAVEAGENLGFLPGDLKEKIDPYLRPLYDALEDMIQIEKLRAFLEKGIIEIAPLAYMRGRTLNNSFIILDEAQNATEMQMKMFLTRLGKNSKIIVTGDITQIDLPRNQRSGLIHATRILNDVEGIGMVHLRATDVVRHRLVRKILAAYEHDEKQQPKGPEPTKS